MCRTQERQSGRMARLVHHSRNTALVRTYLLPRAYAPPNLNLFTDRHPHLRTAHRVPALYHPAQSPWPVHPAILVFPLVPLLQIIANPYRVQLSPLLGPALHHDLQHLHHLPNANRLPHPLPPEQHSTPSSDQTARCLPN